MTALGLKLYSPGDPRSRSQPVAGGAAARDASADGRFVYSVAADGVFCRPSCAARPALRRNVDFHDTPAAAIAAGFRPCLRCRPDLPPKGEREAALVAQACRAIEAAETAPGLDAPSPPRPGSTRTTSTACSAAWPG